MSSRSRAGQHADDAGHRLGARDVDRDDAGVRRRAAQHLAVEHARARPCRRRTRPRRAASRAPSSRCSERPTCGAAVRVGRRRSRRGHPGELADGLDDALVAGAAAEVAGERAAHSAALVRSPAASSDETVSSMPGGAEAALQRGVAHERILEPRELRLLGQPLDRRHVPAVGLHGERAAGADGLAVERAPCRRRTPARRTSAWRRSGRGDRAGSRAAAPRPARRARPSRR